MKSWNFYYHSVSDHLLVVSVEDCTVVADDVVALMMGTELQLVVAAAVVVVLFTVDTFSFLPYA